MAMVPAGAEPVGPEFGEYCPLAANISGRLRYKHTGVSTGNGAPPASPGMLHFDSTQGKWCLGSDCSAPAEGSLDPSGISGTDFDVTSWEDFNGEFKGQGVPVMEFSSGARKSLPARPRPPNRTPPKPVPKGEKFKAEMPKYEEMCLDYGNVWNSIQEAKKTEEDSLSDSKLEGIATEPSEEHPCAIAKGLSAQEPPPLQLPRRTLDEMSATLGIEPLVRRLSGGHGEATYKEISDCQDRDVARARDRANRDLTHAMLTTLNEVAGPFQWVKHACTFIPNWVATALGVGASGEPSNICESLGDHGQTFIQAAIDTPFNLVNWQGELSGADDCNMQQLGIARLLCDVYCVRDAVVRGDRSILTNLEEATRITNHNTKELFKWSAKNQRSDATWLGEKITVLQDYLGDYLDRLCTSISTCTGTEFLQAAHTASASMLEELSGLAAQASLRVAGRKTVLGALRRFSGAAVKLDNRSNIDDVALAFSQLASLHATLRQAGTASKMEALAVQVSRDARELQKRARKHIEILGVYRWHSNFTRSAGRQWQASSQQALARQSLQQMDHLWWTLRDTLDDYLDAAEYEIGVYQDVFSAISAYEGCASTSAQVASAYGRSLAAKDHAGRHLRASWRKSTNLMGEMAAVVDDGAIFQTLMSVEGCNSTLSWQTMLQSQYAVSGILFLQDRFKAAGSATPDLEPLEQSVRRIQDSYRAAKASCES